MFLSELLKTESQVVVVDILTIFEVFALIFNPRKVSSHSFSNSLSGLNVLLRLINDGPKTRTRISN